MYSRILKHCLVPLRSWFRLTAAVLVAIGAGRSQAEEGMWLFTEPPRAQLKERHGFEIKDAWLEHLQKSSVRISDGGSGEFISEDGLVLTNHHVGSGTLQKISTKERDYFESGFYAAKLADEIKAPDLELNVLESIEDVTARVNAAIPTGASNEEAAKARRAILSTIEKESLEKTGLRSDVVTLYQGERYHLYRYHRYTDVRLVFAPEAQIGFYGGDPDNFEYPRFDLDVCFFRAYENGKPAKVRHYLKWSATGTKEGDLVFVSGHPGHTNRSLTMAELEYIRDFQMPFSLQRLFRGEVILRTFSERDPENARRAAEDLFGIQNGRKARLGGQAGLLDPTLFAAQQARENSLREKMAARPEMKSALSAYDRIAAAQKEIAGMAREVALLEEGGAWNSGMFWVARTLLRAADERPKPDGERLREYNDANRESLELGLFSPEPVYKDLEIVKLTSSLTFLTEQLGAASPIAQKVLAGKSPGLRAAELIQNTRLEDVALRKKLYAGDAAAVQAAGDPMIEFARSVDGESRALRKRLDAQLEAKEQAHAALAKARFALEGTASYPDATFTLRLAYGTVKGYEENGKTVPAHTTFAGLYERAEGQKYRPPFHLPQAWLEGRPKLDLSTPFNFVSTADIIGGNSGSPVVNREGEFVGIIFDGNIQSLVLDFAYTDVQARATSVDARGILEALKKIYRAEGLVKEVLTGKRGE